MTTHRLSAADLLALWDRGFGRTPEDRALVLLEAAYPSAEPKELAKLSVGTRDRKLLQLRSGMFGDRCDVFATCPQCATRLEFSINASDLLERMEIGKESGPEACAQEAAVTAVGFTLRFRLPDSTDLAAARQCASAELCKRAIFERCVVEARRGHAVTACEDLPSSLMSCFEAWLERRAAGEELLLQLDCVECNHRWPMLFDPPSFLWAELDRAARLLMEEVGALARAFGWSENDILSMSAVRRSAYLEVAQ